MPLLAGCATYQVGSESLYAPDIATVYVPMIESDSYRRDLGERLTEAVIKEIELKTPYKVVGTPDADSILAVRAGGRHAASAGREQLRRSAALGIGGLRRSELAQSPPAADGAAQSIALPPELVGIDQTANLVPEVGPVGRRRRSSRRSSGWRSRSSARWKRRGEFAQRLAGPCVRYAGRHGRQIDSPSEQPFGSCARGRSNCRGGRC